MIPVLMYAAGMRRSFAGFVLLLGFAVSTGCGGDEGATSSRTAVAAFYPLAWAAEQIAGDDTDVANLTPPGVEPHDLELTPRDVERVRDADVVLYVGGGFMPALEDAVAAHPASLDVLELVDVLDTGSGAVDPHVWLDPNRFAGVVERIAAELGDPDAAAPLLSDLARLDSEYRVELSDCDRHEIVTSHAGFGYLADAYGLRQIALSGLSPEGEPTPRALEALVDEVRRTGATTVFFESLVSPGLAEAIAREAGVGTAPLDPLEGLTEEALDAGEDYLSLMRANLAELKRALGCR